MRKIMPPLVHFRGAPEVRARADVYPDLSISASNDLWAMATWFTSDTHFGHEAIIRYCDRPYKNAAEMTYDIIRRWNETVMPADTVYHLGDFAMGDPERWPSYRRKLNGNTILVRGNHDRDMDRVMDRMGFADVLENTIVEIDGFRLWLNHYPLGIPDHRGRAYARPQAPGPYDIMLCGHVHQQFKVAAGNVNVGVDVWNFTPISAAALGAALLAAV